MLSVTYKFHKNMVLTRKVLRMGLSLHLFKTIIDRLINSCYDEEAEVKKVMENQEDPFFKDKKLQLIL